MIQPVLLLLLLAPRSSLVLVTEVSVLEGSSVTLVCGSSVMDRGYYTCWGRNCDNSWWKGRDCSNPLVKMKGGIITINDSKMYSLSGEDLTISNLQDSRSYCCYVDSSYLSYNDHVTYYSLKVVKGCERNLMNGVDFRINNTMEKFVSQDASQCRQNCTENVNCQYFTFVGKEANVGQPKRDICFLKVSTDDRPVTIQHLQHATSGYSLRNCSGKVTYSAKKYSLVLEEKNWTNAQEYCRQHYTNLSIIHTEEDWKAIQSSLGNFSGDAWIGLHRDKPDPDEKWKWSDGKDFMFFNWATGFRKHMGNDCVISTSSHWQPADCGTVLQYVCQQLVHNENGKTEKKYELMSGHMQWKSALENCKTTGRVLASICNQEEQDAFDEVAKNDHTWIGLKHENNTWNWSSGEPFKKWDNPMHVGDGNCVTLNSKNDRKWTPTNCSTQSIFLCYGDESPLNTTGDLTTPVTPETTTSTSTGPPSTQMSTTRLTTLLHTTTNGQSTTSPTTTTNGQSTTSPTTTTNGQSTTPPTSTSSGQLTSSGSTSPNRQPTTSPHHPDYLHYFNKSKSWINALEFCKSCGSKSNLVHITNQTVQAEVKLLLANMKLPCGGVWIGLERSIFEWSAPWLWTSSDVDKVVKYSEWHSCFPLNPINYHCGKMVRVGSGELKWLDASCHQELPFICQDLH